MNKNDVAEFLKVTGLSLSEFRGEKEIEGSLNLDSWASIPEGFSPVVEWNLYLKSLTSIPEGFNPTVREDLDLSSLTSIPEGFNPTVGGSLDLSSLTSVPEGFNPTIEEDLWLYGLTSLPEGFNPTVGKGLYLNSLTSLPEGFNPTVGGDLDLNSLTSIPEGFNPTVGGRLYLNSLTSLPEGFNPTVGMDLYLNSLTSIPEGVNPTVGEDLWLPGLTSIPEWFNPTVGGGIVTVLETPNKTPISRYAMEELLTWQNGKYRIFDGLFCEVVRRKGQVYRVKINGGLKYVVDGGTAFSHGDSIKQAREDLLYKITSRDSSEYEKLNLDSVIPRVTAVKMYRTLTGACTVGTKMFVERLENPPSEIKVADLIALTEGHYGNDKLKEFFNKGA
jgi:hypothetical protein